MVSFSTQVVADWEDMEKLWMHMLATRLLRTLNHNHNIMLSYSRSMSQTARVVQIVCVFEHGALSIKIILLYIMVYTGARTIGSITSCACLRTSIHYWWPSLRLAKTRAGPCKNNDIILWLCVFFWNGKGKNDNISYYTTES